MSAERPLTADELRVCDFLLQQAETALVLNGIQAAARQKIAIARAILKGEHYPPPRRPRRRRRVASETLEGAGTGASP
jgi:hypothetical protein